MVQTLDVTQLLVLLMVLWVLQLQLMHVAIQLYLHSDGTVSSEGCSRSQTRTFRATDACGNTSTASRTISWIADITPPVHYYRWYGCQWCKLGCNPTAGAINGALGTATATDACGNPTVSTSDGPVSSEGCSRSQTRTFRATDACGNTSTASRTISWIADVTPPVINYRWYGCQWCKPWM